MTGFFRLYNECRLCPRECGVDRRAGGVLHLGLCGQSDLLRVAYVGPHFGEEPPITGKKGSGTVFFSGCPLKCSFCQNCQISHQKMGDEKAIDRLLEDILTMVKETGVHNINFVSPDHFFPHVFALVSGIRQRGIEIPVLMNLSGYQSKEMLKFCIDYADIYLPDFKYSDPLMAARLSSCPDYPETALEAISEMVRQKGFMEISGHGTAKKGVLVRHLILPGSVKNSIAALSTLFIEFGRDLPLSLMSQFVPVAGCRDEDLSRPVSRGEFDRVYEHAAALGFRQMFVQFPSEDEGRPVGMEFTPDFRLADPFCRRQEG